MAFSLWWLFVCSIGSTGVAHGLSCSMACGIFPNQGSNPCLLHYPCPRDSFPRSHQGSPALNFYNSFIDLYYNPTPYNSPILNRIIQRFLVLIHSQICVAITLINFRTFSLPPKEIPYALSVTPHFSTAVGNPLLSLQMCLFWALHINGVVHSRAFCGDFHSAHCFQDSAML